MTKLNNTTTDAEFQKKFKSKINFGDLLDKNDKKNEGTTVSGLLKSTTQTIVAPNSQELDKNRKEGSEVAKNNREELQKSLAQNRQELSENLGQFEKTGFSVSPTFAQPSFKA